MNYVKKMCILRQIKQGFSGDGKALSGLIKIEQYGKNLAIEVSIINFAPLVSGEYYCLLSDGKGKTEMLSLRGKSIFNILSDIDIVGGFCAIICFVKNEVIPIAYGINGKGSYNWRAILKTALPPVFPQKQEGAGGEIAFDEQIPPTMCEPTHNTPTMYAANKTETTYNDEEVATENYYEEKKNERIQPSKADENARTQSAAENQNKEARANAEKDVDAQGVLPLFATDTDGYYLSIKRELDELFSTYPEDGTLQGAFQHSKWVRLKGEKGAPQYLVGALYEEGKARYICYALAAKDKASPPEEIKKVCAFVPTSCFEDSVGFFVIFQSAATGECIKPERI
jgi:hypothetical protein